jgi:hypothetical protein
MSAEMLKDIKAHSEAEGGRRGEKGDEDKDGDDGSSRRNRDTYIF